MTGYDTPTDHAAALILTTAPAAQRIAANRGWIGEDGWIDWDRVEADFDQMGYLSRAEHRLIRCAILLHEADLGGLDRDNGEAVGVAFRAAADGYFQDVAAAEDAAARIRRGGLR